MWGTSIPIEEKICIHQPDIETIMIGTIFKEATIKPNLLKEYSKSRAISVPKHQNYTDEKDAVYLEDEESRVKLVGPNLGAEKLLTGIVVGVRGMTKEDGSVEVIDYITAGFAPQKTLGSPEQRYVAFVSGVQLTSECDGKDRMALGLLADYFSGHYGDEREQFMLSNVVRLVVAGNIFSQADINNAVKDPTKKLSTKEQYNIMEVVKGFQEFVLALAQ